MMKLCRNENNMYRTRRKYYVVGRKLDSNQCGLRSILGFHAICELSLLLILYSAPSGFSPSAPAFSSPQNPTFDLLQLLWFDQWCPQLGLQRNGLLTKVYYVRTWLLVIQNGIPLNFVRYCGESYETQQCIFVKYWESPLCTPKECDCL